MTSLMHVTVSHLYAVMFGRAGTAFNTYFIDVEVHIVSMSNDIPAEYRVFERAGEGSALMHSTVPALRPQHLNIYF